MLATRFGHRAAKEHRPVPWQLFSCLLPFPECWTLALGTSGVHCVTTTSPLAQTSAQCQPWHLLAELGTGDCCTPLKGTAAENMLFQCLKITAWQLWLNVQCNRCHSLGHFQSLPQRGQLWRLRQSLLQFGLCAAVCFNPCGDAQTAASSCSSTTCWTSFWQYLVSEGSNTTFIRLESLLSFFGGFF